MDPPEVSGPFPCMVSATLAYASALATDPLAPAIGRLVAALLMITGIAL